jgi:alcohol dehydrogenase (quinone), cytochrome c subunit
VGRAASRGLLIGLALALLILIGALIVARLPTHTRLIQMPRAAGTDAESIARGRYIAVAADCTACHTAPGGKPFAGGLAIDSPIGTIYSSNITPDLHSGIGGYTLDDFDRAVRHGITPDGNTLYPAMPFPSYARLSDEDIALLYGYFMHAVEPVVAERHQNGIPWPLSMRWPLAVWRKAFAPSPDAPAFDASRFADSSVARGAYLVQGAGHCGTCHTPRAITLQEKALDESSALYLSGGQRVGGWVAVNLRGNAADGLGDWSKSDIVATLRTARNAQQAVIGTPMSDVVVHSTQYLTDEDLLAIAAYLKSLPASPDDKSGFAADPATAAALAAGIESDRGAQLYDDNCAACHRSDAAGSARVLPKIAGDSSVLSADPNSLIRLVLSGASLPATAGAPSPLGMPGFGWRLSNTEVSQLLTFIRSSWGNRAPPVSTGEVGRVRAALESEYLSRANLNN